MDRREFLGGVAGAGAVAMGLQPLLAQEFVAESSHSTHVMLDYSLNNPLAVHYHRGWLLENMGHELSLGRNQLGDHEYGTKLVSSNGLSYSLIEIAAYQPIEPEMFIRVSSLESDIRSQFMIDHNLSLCNYLWKGTTVHFEEKKKTVATLRLLSEDELCETVLQIKDAQQWIDVNF